MKFDVICVGMALVDNIIRGFHPEPVSASGFTAESASLHVGGEAVNAAMAAAKLGLKTGILCALGKDAAGSMVISALEKCGVNTHLIVETSATPVTTMFVGSDGSRKSITNQAHRVQFYPEKYTANCTDAKAILLGSLFRAPFDDPEIICSVVSAAREAGQMMIADTKLPNFRKLALRDLADSLPMIDYITPNEDEARYFTHAEEPEAMADMFLKHGVRNVIIKLGRNGCILKNEHGVIRLPAYRIDAVDATGAGDHFAAGFISEMLRGKQVEEALHFANACGAICTTMAGADTALKSREQVLRWMEERRS